MSVATEQSSLEKLSVDTIRTLSMDAVEKAASGHPGTPMALAPVAYALYARVMKHDPADPEWIDRDRFVLSAGHASMLLYSILHLSGYDVSMDDLKNFRQLGSPTAGHPEQGHLPGIETTTGPLGQGIATAVGMALAERMLAARYNRDQKIIDHHTFVIASDGDMQEGVQSEAASLAGHLGLGRLIVLYDDNHISIEGDTAVAFSEDVGKRYESYGWDVKHLGEDVEVETLVEAFEAAKAQEQRPTLIVARTHIGYGAPNKQDTGSAHGSPLGDDEIEAAKKFYDFPSMEPFFVPDGVYDHYKELIGKRAKLHENWKEQWDAYEAANPELAAELMRARDKQLPDGWDEGMELQEADEKGMATRKASEAAIQWAAKALPELVGGSADLAGSTNTIIKDADSIARDNYGGRNFHWGIREHAMGAAVNGLTLSGFRAYGATFMTFSDYMKGAIRVGAIMCVPSIWVFTHDSIGLGEDGPTHQPIEQLVHLRATPNLNVIRPADYNETQLAWRFALRSSSQPTALSLSRQNTPTLDPSAVPDDAIERGAYVLKDADGTPDVILIGTGTEVQLALDAAEQLDDLKVRVVSMPCMDTFVGQDDEYRNSVLPPEVKARVAVEAAGEFSWHRWVGDYGEIVGMTSYGASAPAGDVYEHFGITAERVAKCARASVERAA
jgi:transketolase